MSKKYLMTWNGKQGRWFKKHAKRQYVVSLKELRSQHPHLVQGDTKEGTYRAANAWWQEKVRTLTAHPYEAELIAGSELRGRFAEWCRLEQQEHLRAAILDEMDTLRAALRTTASVTVQKAAKDGLGHIITTGIFKPRLYVGDLAVDPFNANEVFYHGEELHVWKQRLEAVKQHELWEAKQHDLSLEQAIQLFLDDRAAEVSPLRVSNLRLYLRTFQHWKANNKLAISELELLAYKTYLTDLVANSKKANETARSELKAVKAFVNWAWYMRLIDDLPRNIQKKGALQIVCNGGKKVIWTDEQVKLALTTATGKMRLYLLLSLNTGMYSGDMAKLTHDQVDWEEGRITWTRSKTGIGGELSYKLWPETLELLRRFRSDHPSLLLTTEKGTSLSYSQAVAGHRVRRCDNIGIAFYKWNKRHALNLPALKNLRKTARCKLEENNDFSRFGKPFLQQKDYSTDGKWYKHDSQFQFDNALEWLRTQFIDS